MGGYQILNFEKINLVPDAPAVDIPGLHDKIEGSYGKPLMIQNAVIDGVEKTGAYVQNVINEAGNHELDYNGYIITVTGLDKVTVAEKEA